MNLTELAQKAKQSSYVLGTLSAEVRNRALAAVAAGLKAHAAELLKANALDLQEAQKALTAGRLKPAVYARLKLDQEKLAALINAVEDVMKLPDPIGRTLAATDLDEHLSLYKVSCPLGVLLVIFEARPDVIAQIVSLAIKSANAVILKGGKESFYTNNAMFSVLLGALKTVPSFPLGAISLVHTREESAALLQQEKYIDLVIPRGGNALIKYVKDNTHIPVLGHADGVCHIYVARSAELKMAQQVCLDAKTQYPAACNAVETLLIDQAWPDENKKALLLFMQEAGVQIHGGAEIEKLVPSVLPVLDWHKEYGEKSISVQLVPHVLAAGEHINTYGSGHTDCILTENKEEARVFMDLVDSAGVYHNASTRFADGFRYGFGAEVGISTAKTHARGPVGLDGLTIYKYYLYGNGQKVADYVGPNAHKFLHKKRDGGIQ